MSKQNEVIVEESKSAKVTEILYLLNSFTKSDYQKIFYELFGFGTRFKYPTEVLEGIWQDSYIPPLKSALMKLPIRSIKFLYEHIVDGTTFVDLGLKYEITRAYARKVTYSAMSSTRSAIKFNFFRYINETYFCEWELKNSDWEFKSRDWKLTNKAYVCKICGSDNDSNFCKVKLENFSPLETEIISRTTYPINIRHLKPHEFLKADKFIKTHAGITFNKLFSERGRKSLNETSKAFFGNFGNLNRLNACGLIGKNHTDLASWSIGWLIVPEIARKNGIGSALLSALENFAVKNQIRYSNDNCIISLVTEMPDFFSHRNYEAINVRNGFTWMIKEIQNNEL